MALQLMDDFTFKHSGQLDALYTQYTAQQIKSLFDSRGDELRTALNLLITTLKSTEGASDIGTSTIQDVDGTNVQDMLKSIRDKLKSKADSLSGADYVGATAIAGLSGETVQSLLESLKNYADSLTASDIEAAPIAVGSGTTVQAQLAWLLSQIAIAATGSIPDNSLGESKLAQALVDKINTALSNTGLLTTLTTIDKSSAVNAINELVTNIVNLAGAGRTTETIKGNSDAIANLNQKVTSHEADNSAHGIGDKTTLLTTNKTSIVSAMNELFTNANNGKIGIANVIGSPALSGDTFDALKNYMQNNKNTLATNLTNKGQSSTGTETLANLVAKVANVNTGKKYASGLVTATANTSYQTYPFTVSGLNFTPGCIILEYTFNYQAINYSFRRIYHGAYQGLNSYNLDIPAICFKSTDTNGSVYLTGMTAFAINSDGFTTTIGATTTGWSVNINWYAWE